MKIGIFDSGVGGITVLKEAIKHIPYADYIYYADNLHVPYGTKSKEEVFGYVKEVVELLISEGADIIVIACNTATCIAVKRLRSLYSVPIIGMEPAVKLALQDRPRGKVLVAATPLTLKSDKYIRLVNEVDKDKRALALPLPELVSFAENKMFEEHVLDEYFDSKFNLFNLDEVSGIVLGCTHFVYYKTYLQSKLPSHIEIYDGNEGTVRHLIKYLEPCPNKERGKIEFYYSGKKCSDLELLNSYLKLL